MKELKNYTLLIDKKKELEHRANSLDNKQSLEIIKELQELEMELNKYHAAFELLTDREKEIIKLRYEKQLSIVAVCNLLYISKTRYYDDLLLIEARLYSFFEGVEFGQNMLKIS